ncbi:DUF4038 domain-containing protein [Persicitalea sp.]|uniref:apiosidase-like domain-containing protein n=1 Tax=Persicitalea sp. TaxID=3100273 RepID=UPI003593ADE3
MILQNKASTTILKSGMLEISLSLFVLASCLCLSCRSSRQPEKQSVAYDNAWASPYRTSVRYPHALENDQGNFLYVLNKTAWAYFACADPAAVLAHTKKHGANVIRVCLEGTPYFKELNYDLWPWGGTRAQPDYASFNEPYWNRVEERIRLAGAQGIGIDLVLYFTLKPEKAESAAQKKYWDYAIERLGKYSNILAWEIMNEEIGNEGFQDIAGAYFKQNDPYHHPVISSDGTTEDALWPHKSWMDLAVVHTCTGNQPQYDLADWYLSIARNTGQYGKPAFNNESGREMRHKNDDPIFRRKQGWVFANSGCFWTWHSWDGCEGINDTTYFAAGYESLVPMVNYYQSIPFWKMEQNFTLFKLDADNLVSAVMATPDRDLAVIYCAAKQSQQRVPALKAAVRIKNGTYAVRFLEPATLKVVQAAEFRSKGLQNLTELALPPFQDDLLIEITAETAEKKSLIEGTR